MKKQLCLVALGVALSMGMAHAADTKEPTKQQNKMGECNKSAGDTTGDERGGTNDETAKEKPASGGDADRSTWTSPWS